MRWKMARYNYQKGYQYKHYRNFNIVMKKDEDKELIEFLKTKENKSAYIKELVRRDMDGTTDDTSR